MLRANDTTVSDATVSRATVGGSAVLHPRAWGAIAQGGLAIAE